MNNKTIQFKGFTYPYFQAIGNAAQFAIPFAKHFCTGTGYDIGCNRREWAFPGAELIDPALDPTYDAYCLPDKQVDYIFSSHCLEHLPNWVTALDYWIAKLKSSGTLFLYLPHRDQEYWKPWNNRKHVHMFDPSMIVDYLKKHTDIDAGTVFYSERDMNHSFMVAAFKK